MLLSGDVGDIKPKQREYLGDVSELCKKMTSIIVLLLNTAKIEMGTFSIEPVSMNVANSLNASVDSMSPAATRRGIVFERNIDPGLPMVNADPKLLGIVFDNLVSNAVNYTMNKGHVSVFAGVKDNDILISIADDGIGIPQEDQPKLFSKLFRSNNAKETDVSGTGIGLYLARSIVESWNGSIYCESPQKGKDKGTVFFVTVPLSGMKKREGQTNIIF